MSKLTVPAEKTLAEVIAFPDEVTVEVFAQDGTLTPDQARELAAMLIEAADKAPHLDFEEDDKGDLKVVERVTA